LEVTPKKVFMIFVGEKLQTKLVQKLVGQVWRNTGKNPSHLQIFACSYTYDRICRLTFTISDIYK